MDTLLTNLPRELRNLVDDYDTTHRDHYRHVVASIEAVLRIPPSGLGRHSSVALGPYDAFVHPPITRKDGACGPSFIIHRQDHTQNRNEWCRLARVDGSPGTWLRPFEALLRYRVDEGANLSDDVLEEFADLVADT
jgi:hypothetical protein